MRRKPKPPIPVKETGGLHSEKQGRIMAIDGETKTIERLDRLVDGVDKIAAGMDKLIAAIPKPASRIRRAIELFATIATVAGILSVIDTIKNWIGE